MVARASHGKPPQIGSNVAKSKAALTKIDLVRQLPAILSGKAPDKLAIRQVFLAHFTHAIMERVGEAFEIKSEGGTDDLGHTFEKLKPSTIHRKSTPKYKRKYPLAVAHNIMRTSDRLISSLSAGTFSGDAYLPPKNQIVQFRQGILKIYSNLKYAKYQFNRRAFWADDIVPWISAALKIAMEAVAARLKVIFQ